MKILKYILVLLSPVLLVRCSKLDEKPYTFISPENFYRNEDDLDKVLNAVYKAYQDTYVRNTVEYYMKLICASEFGAPAYTKNNPHLYNIWYDVNNPANTVDVWSGSYKLINLANLVVGKGADIEMDEAVKERMFGEARFLRALTYFNLLRLYGGVPIPQSYTDELNDLDLARSTADDTYDYIIADLEYASAHLLPKSQNTDVWRASSGAAKALLGKVYLYRGSMTGNVDYFKQSRDVLKEVVNSGEYSLEPDFRDLWKWWNTNNENGRESVFEIQLGNKPDEDNEFHRNAGINLTDASLGAYMYRRYGPSFTAYNSFSDLDYRKASTFLTQITLSTGTTIKWQESDEGFYPGSQGWQTSGPGIIKYYDRTPESFSTGYAGNNYYAMRYAEVLLNYAEAENMSNGSPTTEAYDAINLVRNRAHLTNLASGLSFDQFNDALYRERGWELVGEGELYFDGIRTDRIGKAVKEEIQYGIDHGIYLYEKLQFVPTKNFLWKIPQFDYDSNPALEQNPDNVSGG